MRRLLLPALAALLLPLSACAIDTSSLNTQAEPEKKVAPAQMRKLEDWRIRAGLYEDHHAPMVLGYAQDSQIDDRTYAGQCRESLLELKPYTKGLLNAPTPALRKVAAKAHRANVAYLQTCVQGRTVAFHHAQAALDVASAEVNTVYARTLGMEPGRYDTPKVFG